MKLNAKQLRVTLPTEEQLSKIKRRPIYIVLDNVLDTYNVGSIFRLADAVAAQEVVLCGQTETPPNSRIHKAAVGTEEWVQWQYFTDARTAITKLKLQMTNLKVIVVEQSPRSISLSQLSISNQPLAIVVGHETDGISKEVLDLADQIVEIPMFGVNKSLNVHVAASIVLYKLISFV
jgi:tRNA G18 (ribose-2'-O)-methylase SpoU